MKSYFFFRKIVVFMVAVLSLFFLGCNKRSKNKFFGSNKVCYNLTREIYVVSAWGALSAETYSDYLTDSTNFRIFIGTSGEDENFAYDCANDSVYVIRLIVKGVEKAKVVDTLKVYNLSDLKIKKIFE